MKLFTYIFAALLTLTAAQAQYGHWELIETEHYPLPCQGGRMASIGKNSALHFGGFAVVIYEDTIKKQERVNHTWLFDLNKRDWTKIECKNNPSPRWGAALCQISENKVLLYGGGETSEYYDDLWLFDLEKLDWEQLYPAPQDDTLKPMPLSFSRLAKLTDTKVILYGGEETWRSEIPEEHRGSQTWIYHIDDNRWEFVTWLEPIGRYWHQMCDIDSNLVLMIGGYPAFFQNRIRTENWIFNGTDQNWSQLQNLNPNIDTRAIDNSDMVRIGKGLAFMYGGDVSHNDAYDSSWIFDYYKQSWIKLQIDNAPGGRRSHSMARVDSNKVVVYGGADHASIEDHKTWLFVLDSLPTKVEERSCEINDDIKAEQTADGDIHISFITNSVGNSRVQIYDIQGNILFDKQVTNTIAAETVIIVPFDTYPSGVYFIVITDYKSHRHKQFNFIK